MDTIFNRIFLNTNFAGNRPGISRDRAAVVAVAIAQIASRLPLRGDLRATIEPLLREEFADIERTAINEIRLHDD